ncbi:protein ABSCISIC ACID-INSENSITIVE 5-like [Phoenix dactylifera]|uniref:Protein ABSCISIC ACID-INSENSITIVE 5-like n=1 Tax=Phoenix dactylifera TaxID=42345 RepID=A0A8B8J0A7_PHODC|nr:protein ABSCISIC ACID-INSENSITIVE 5-like [Phoenix dactylifera]
MMQPSILSLASEKVLTTELEPDNAIDFANMEDFLTNLWASSDDARTSAIAPNTSSISPPLHSQASSLHSPFCQKTMDEVWAKIKREQTVDSPHIGYAHGASHQSPLEEMTLEDFLVKVGVIKTGHNSCLLFSLSPQQSPCNNSSLQIDGEEREFNHMLELGCKDPGSLVCTKSGPSLGGVHLGGGENMGEAGFGAQWLEMGSPVKPRKISPASTDSLSLEHADGLGVYGREEAGGRSGRGKRALNEMIGRVMERRKRRMIKNRESAARSRARKRAYTLELETEVNQLKEENALLQEDKQKL